MKTIKLFCLAHAGGSALYYSQWKKKAKSGIEIIQLELPGRGRRMAENLYNCFDEAVSDLLNQVNAELDDCDFAFFGHSMGTSLAYELAYKIKETKNKEPLALFFSGTRPLHIKEDKKHIHLLKDKDFINEVAKYGGMPDEVIQEKNLMEIVVPILKADFRLLDTYEFLKKETKFNCDIVALNGIDDEEVDTESLLLWNEHTNGSCDMYEFEGGHFYINNNVDKVIDIINKKLLESGK